MRKLIIAASLSVLFSSAALAQSGTNSPYSQYGIGILSDPTAGFNRGMDGLGLGFREHNQVNYLNPASYSGVDSLSFIFDAGLSLNRTNYKEGGRQLNANNSNLEYVVAAFRAFRHMGVSFGILPFSNIGYDYTSTSKLGNSTTTITNEFTGEGGLHQAYVGVGYEPIKNLSVGFNAGYVWGDIDKSVVNSYSDSYIGTNSRYYTAELSTYKLDLGAQYTLGLTKKDQLTIGATYSLGHKINGDAKLQQISYDQGKGYDTATYVISDAYKMPNIISVGVMYNRDNKLKVGADFSLQKWGSIAYPMLVSGSDSKGSYQLVDGVYKDRKHITLGADYCPDYTGYQRGFLKHVHYRAGVSYTTPYYNINGVDGPKEFSVSAGFGIPIINAWNNRSQLNISGQWVRRTASNFITENSFRINIGITFNERWFAKWKVD